MLIKSKDLQGYKLNSLDGEIGSVQELYFDDRHWVVRYLVADNGGWLPGRQVLISPHALGALDRDRRHIAVGLTKQAIEGSPGLDSAKPVSRRFELDYHGYYGWPMYSAGPFLWGATPIPVHDSVGSGEPTKPAGGWDPHLRSSLAVIGYHVEATDGEIGSVADFIVDDQSWAIRYLVVDTGHWLPGKKVLVSPHWIDAIRWGDSQVSVNLLRDSVRSSPELTDAAMLTREYESKLYRHYDREGYWVYEAAPAGRAI